MEVVWLTSPAVLRAQGAGEAVLQASAGVVPKKTAGLVEQLFAGQELLCTARLGQQVAEVGG